MAVTWRKKEKTLSTLRTKVCKLGMLSHPRIKSLEHSHQSLPLSYDMSSMYMAPVLTVTLSLHHMPGSVSIVLRNGLSWSGSPMHPAPEKSDMCIMGPSDVQETHRITTHYCWFSLFFYVLFSGFCSPSSSVLGA